MRHKHTLTRGIPLTLLLTAGLATSLLVATPTAEGYTTTDLLNLGYAVLEINLPGGCHEWKAAPPHVGNRTDIGDDCSPGFQAALDAFITATCPATLCPKPVTTTVTNTATVTTAQTTTDSQTVTQPQTIIQQLPAPATQTIIIKQPMPQPPIAAFTVTTQGLIATFTDGSGTDGTVSWQFGDGTVGGGSPVGHGYTKAGVYSVLETVIDKDGLASQTMQDVTVDYAPRQRSG